MKISFQSFRIKKEVSTGLYFSLLMLLSFGVNGQCKFKVNESDPFTSEKHLVTKNIRLNGDMKSANESKFFAITNMERKGSVFKWNFEFYERALRDNKSMKATKLKIKTKSGVTELTTDAIPDPKYTLEENSQMTELDFYFDITSEQLKMMEGGVEIIGIDIFGESKLFKVNTLAEVSEGAKCLQQ